MISSGGQIVLADTTPTFANTYYAPSIGVNLAGFFSSYQAIYRNQVWVYTVVRKLALGTARLPLKVYKRDDRTEQRDNPYAKLLANPNPIQNSKHFWEWTVSTLNVFGEAIWLKVRGRNGQPQELWPVHPINIAVHRVTSMVDDVALGAIARQAQSDGDSLLYVYNLGSPAVPRFIIPQRDVVHFRTYNPDTTLRGLSPLEPLRQTLLNEDAARRATTSFWVNGARPAVALSHPKKLQPDAAARLKANWDAVAAGPDNTGKTVVLEEGMEPKILQIANDEAQYIETRKLNREEVTAVYDIPPPVVHILDRATFSNITEQMRSMYRDTMAPRLQLLEADLDFQLRSDFSSDDSIYAEFLMDEVLRGDFEVRMDAYQKAIGSAQKTPNEARKLENLTPIDGGDRLFINSTLIPIDEVSSRTSPNPPAEAVPGSTPAVEEAPTAAPALIPRRTPSDQAPAPKALDPQQARLLLGRLRKRKSIDDVDPVTLVEGLNGEGKAALNAYVAASDIDDLRQRLKELACLS